MKRLILIIFLLISIKSIAQKKDTVKYFVDVNLKQVDEDKAIIIFKVYQNDAKSWIFSTYNMKDVIQQKETYLDSLLTTKQGPYVEYKFGKTSLKGSYLNNMRHGNFVDYDTSGVVREVSLYNLDSLKSKISYWPNGGIKEEMTYRNDNKLAKKSLFYEDGKVALKEVYGINNSLIERIYLDINGKQAKETDIMSPPVFPGGIDRFYRFLGSTIRYPEDALKADISGKVFTSFTITETGEVTDIKIERKLFPSLDREAERVLKISPKWLPGKMFGKAVRVRYSIPIGFSLNGGN